jgi:hypothetical protein
METKKVTFSLDITLEEAKRFDKSDNKLLKRIAETAYTRSELDEPEWKNIKTFEDACNVLGIDSSFELNGAVTKYDFRKHLIALYKLDIIRQALNKDYKPSLVHGVVYYPCIRFYKSYNNAENAVKSNDWEFCGKVEIKDTSYYLVSGDYNECNDGLGDFYYCNLGYGVVFASPGLLCCESIEIVQHMSKYFAKEIFDALYANNIKDYKWYSLKK